MQISTEFLTMVCDLQALLRIVLNEFEKIVEQVQNAELDIKPNSAL